MVVVVWAHRERMAAARAAARAFARARHSRPMHSHRHRHLPPLSVCSLVPLRGLIVVVAFVLPARRPPVVCASHQRNTT